MDFKWSRDIKSPGDISEFIAIGSQRAGWSEDSEIYG